jgi:hypothetical protein
MADMLANPVTGSLIFDTQKLMDAWRKTQNNFAS